MRTSACEDLIKKLIKDVSDMSSITQAESAYKDFCQTRIALDEQKMNSFEARKKALSCWRELTNLIRTDFMPKPQVVDLFSLIMFLELADCLRRLYTSDHKHSTAGWFCSFLLSLARRLKCSFLVAKYQAHYVENLQCTYQISEALVQAHLLQSFLIDEFGEDYLDWLADAPHASRLCEELESTIG